MKNKIIIAIIIIIVSVSALYVIKQNKNNPDNPDNQDSYDLSSSVDDEFINNINEINQYCKVYFDEYNNKAKFLSIYGYLYDQSKSNVVNISDIEENTEFQNNQNITDIDILYVRPSDLAEYKNFQTDFSDDQLCIFTSVKIEEGYLISSYKYSGGILSEDDMKEFIMQYVSNHGDIINPAADSEEYKNIINAVNSFVGQEKEYDVKHIACDQKYAAVVLGDINNVADIREYALKKGSEGWEIIISELEKAENQKVTVNSSYHDFELGLLPIYNINDYGLIQTGFDGYIDSMKELNLIDDLDLPVSYSCGAGGFVYMEFSSQKKLLGFVNENKELSFYPVQDTKETISTMVQLSENPPVFIIKMS